MASTSGCNFDTIFRFTADVTKLASNPIESSAIKLSGIDWKVKLQKRRGNNNPALGVYLVSEFGDNTIDWSCAALATLKLLRNDDETEQSIVKYLPKQKFSKVKPLDGFDEFVDWDDFLKHFVNGENKAVFDVEISTEPLYRKVEMDVDERYAKFRVIVEKVDKLGSCYSSGTVARGIKWQLNVKKDGDKLSGFLHADEKNMDMNWYYDAQATVQLISFNKTIESKERKIINTFSCGLSGWGYTEFMSWADFMSTEKQFVRDNKAIFVVELKVSEPEPQWQVADYKLSKGNSLLLCVICLECGDIFSIKCGHLFCKPCFEKAMEKIKFCPSCNKKTCTEDLHPIFFA